MDKNIAALLDTSAYTIKVMFKEGKTATPKSYTYVCNIPGVKPGDWVVVDGPDFDDYVNSSRTVREMVSIDEAIEAGNVVFTGMPKLVLVTMVDKEVDIEPDSAIKLKWVVAKLDLTNYKETMQRNSQITGLVAEAYKKSMRKSFADRILGDMEDSNKTALLSLLHKPVPAADTE